MRWLVFFILPGRANGRLGVFFVSQARSNAALKALEGSFGEVELLDFFLVHSASIFVSVGSIPR